jgi:hypothetical protein
MKLFPCTVKIKYTGASRILVVSAILTISITIALAFNYTSKHIPNVGYSIAIGFIIAFAIEIILRLATKRVVSKQIKTDLILKLKDMGKII